MASSRIDLRSRRRQKAALLMSQDALEEQGYSLEWIVLDEGYRYVLRDQEQEVVDVAWSQSPVVLMRQVLRLAGLPRKC